MSTLGYSTLFSDSIIFIFFNEKYVNILTIHVNKIVIKIGYIKLNGSIAFLNLKIFISHVTSINEFRKYPKTNPNAIPIIVNNTVSLDT